MSITLHDVARLAGVSIKTVSNVINDYPHVRPTTREKVEQAINELGYQPNLTARGLRSGRTGAISLVIPDLRNAYFAELADAVMTAARAQGLFVLIEQTRGDREAELQMLRGPRTQMVDGILYSVLGMGQEDAHFLDTPTPLVLLGERIFNGPADHVTMHNVKGAQAATEHLIDIGRTRIAAIGAHRGEVIGSAGLRLTGYRQALEESGLLYREELVSYVQEWHRKDGAASMRELLDRGVRLDGLVAFNDELALGAMRVIQEAGLVVPRDIAVIGFDDIDETRYSLPTLTTINPGREEIADVAVRWLMERIANPGGSIAPREHLTRFELIRRESTRA
jgi:DNA-binding LacI/PurR family transcriptional regulator